MAKEQQVIEKSETTTQQQDNTKEQDNTKTQSWSELLSQSSLIGWFASFFYKDISNTNVDTNKIDTNKIEEMAKLADEKGLETPEAGMDLSQSVTFLSEALNKGLEDGVEGLEEHRDEIEGLSASLTFATKRINLELKNNPKNKDAIKQKINEGISSKTEVSNLRKEFGNLEVKDQSYALEELRNDHQRNINKSKPEKKENPEEARLANLQSSMLGELQIKMQKRNSNNKEGLELPRSVILEAKSRISPEAIKDASVNSKEQGR
jgi:hypothetical protein